MTRNHLSDPQAMRELLEHDVDLVIDSGYCGVEVTTVIDLDPGKSGGVAPGQG